MQKRYALSYEVSNVWRNCRIMCWLVILMEIEGVFYNPTSLCNFITDSIIYYVVHLPARKFKDFPCLYIYCIDWVLKLIGQSFLTFLKCCSSINLSFICLAALWEFNFMFIALVAGEKIRIYLNEGGLISCEIIFTTVKWMKIHDEIKTRN